MYLENTMSDNSSLELTFETLLFEVADNVATITLNRPDAANALNLQMSKDLMEASILCADDPEIRAVLFTGAGKMFCAGGDLQAFAATGDGLSSEMKRMTAYWHNSMARFARMDALLICAVNGTAAGGGLSMAVMGDIVIAADTARFTMAYTSAGLSPDGGSSYNIPRLIGMRRAQELMLTNRLLSASQAAEWGLITDVVAPEDLMAKTRQLATEMAHGPTAAYGSVKRLLLTSLSAGLEEQMEIESQEISANGRGVDGQEGITAFLNKRKPSFKGHR
jgi:2-(1,2-epoxy-1,2-dihydrophenyl)acetyl-CoA isomerase